MAVSIDTGEFDDVHPKNKKPVADRLVLLAKAIAYDEDIVYSGPLYKSHEIIGNKVVVEFTHTGSGLEFLNNQGLGFELCGSDQVYKTANATITAPNKIEIWSDLVSAPVNARYAYRPWPQNVNLYNIEGLPAGPFKTDAYPYKSISEN